MRGRARLRPREGQGGGRAGASHACRRIRVARAITTPPTALSDRQMFDDIFNMRFLPPGRGLWAMGTALTEDRGLFAALNNCGFVTTARLGANERGVADPFCFLMEASMLGVGVGFDCRGAGSARVVAPRSDSEPDPTRANSSSWLRCNARACARKPALATPSLARVGEVCAISSGCSSSRFRSRP